MAKGMRACHTQEFKEEAVRPVSGGERVAVSAGKEKIQGHDDDRSSNPIATR